MSTLFERVQAALAPLVPAGKAWPGQNTQQPPIFPYIVFFRVVSESNMTLDGPSDVQNTRFQVDCWALRMADVDALARAVKATMLEAPFSVGAITEQDVPPDPDTKGYRITLDFSCWSAD